MKRRVTNDLAASNATGAQVAVWLDGECHYVGGFGSASAFEDQEVTEDTLFMIGSDTKKITAILALQQVEAGTLTLDTPISELLPEFQPPNALDFADATLHELLSHQGGVSDYANFTTETTDEALYETAHGLFGESAWSMAEPGTFWNYSNPNFSLVGLMDETASESWWADRAYEGLFEPLGMAHSYARKADLEGPVSLGNGYSEFGDTTLGPVSLEDTWEAAFVRPSGLVWSTAMDQCTLAAFLLHGNTDVLSDESLAWMQQPHVNTYPDLPGGYGYGMFFSDGAYFGPDFYELPLWSHGGNTISHTSTFYVLPDQDFAIVILSNGYGDNFVGSVVNGVRTLVELPSPGTAPPSEPVDLSRLDDLTGTYQDPYNLGEIIISTDGSRLTVSMPDLDATSVPYNPTLSPLSTHVWIVTIQGIDYDVSFYEGDDNEMWLRNRSFVGYRGADGVAPFPVPPRPAVEREARIRAMLEQARQNPMSDPIRALSTAR